MVLNTAIILESRGVDKQCRIAKCCVFDQMPYTFRNALQVSVMADGYSLAGTLTYLRLDDMSTAI